MITFSGTVPILPAGLICPSVKTQPASLLDDASGLADAALRPADLRELTRGLL
jgi:hypothetical protein